MLLIDLCGGRVLTPITVKAPYGTGKERVEMPLKAHLDSPSTPPFDFLTFTAFEQLCYAKVLFVNANLQF